MPGRQANPDPARAALTRPNVVRPCPAGTAPLGTFEFGLARPGYIRTRSVGLIRPDPNPAQPRFYPVRSARRVGTIRPGSILSDPAGPRSPVWSGPIRAGPALPKCTMGKPGPTRPCALAMATAMVIYVDRLGVRPSGGRRVVIFRVTPMVISWGVFFLGAAPSDFQSDFLGRLFGGGGP